MIDAELFEERLAIVQEGNGWSAEEALAFCRTLFADEPLPGATEAPVPVPEVSPLPAYEEAMEAFRQDMRTLFHLPGAHVAPQEDPPVPSPPPVALTLRPYQADVLRAILDALDEGEHPVANVATGGGKSLIIAALCAQLPGRVLVVTHRKKLIQQNAAQLARWGIDQAEIGVYSAGLRQRDTRHRVVFAGVQSIYRRMAQLQAHGAFDVVIVDECHLVPPPAQDSMYATVLRALPAGAQRVGLSATPSRMGTPIWGPEQWFSVCAATVDIASLTAQGYLTPLTGILTARDVDLSAVAQRQGDFVLREAAEVLSEQEAAARALDEVCVLAYHREAWLVFCCDIAHSILVQELLEERGITCGLLHSRHDPAANDAALAAFAAGELRALVSCEMLTTGVDLPRADCGILLRPTMSKELLVQMLGRLTRRADGKEDALILDYAGNLERHVPLDELATTKKTPEREARDAAREQEEREQEDRRARHASTIFGQAYPVEAMEYFTYHKKDDPGKGLCRVTYLCPAHPRKRITIYLCLEGYGGKARQETDAWFQRRGVPHPGTLRACQVLVQHLPRPATICVQEDGVFFRVTQEHFPHKP